MARGKTSSVEIGTEMARDWRDEGIACGEKPWYSDGEAGDVLLFDTSPACNFHIPLCVLSVCVCERLVNQLFVHECMQLCCTEKGARSCCLGETLIFVNRRARQSPEGFKMCLLTLSRLNGAHFSTTRSRVC